MDVMRIEEGKDGQFYWNRTAPNNEIIAQGEGYTREPHAFQGAFRQLEGEVCIIRPNGTKVYYDLKAFWKPAPDPPKPTD